MRRLRRQLSIKLSDWRSHYFVISRSTKGGVRRWRVTDRERTVSTDMQIRQDLKSLSPWRFQGPADSFLGTSLYITRLSFTPKLKFRVTVRTGLGQHRKSDSTKFLRGGSEAILEKFQCYLVRIWNATPSVAFLRRLAGDAAIHKTTGSDSRGKSSANLARPSSSSIKKSRLQSRSRSNEP